MHRNEPAVATLRTDDESRAVTSGIRSRNKKLNARVAAWPATGAGKPVAGHAATRAFNFLFRLLIPEVTARDSSSVLKVATAGSFRCICDALTCLDYSIDQDILAMTALRGSVIEIPIEWYQARGVWG